MFLITYISGQNQQQCQMYFDGFLDDGKSDFITCYRFFNCKDYMKHVYFTFPRTSVIKFKEVNFDDKYRDKKDFLERFQKL